MAVFNKLDEKELASLIKRTKILGDKVAIVDKKTIANMSNTFTGIQNAFNSILTYSKNMNKIQEAKLEDLAANTKETQLEAPRAAPIAAATPAASSDSELLAIIPKLIRVVNELDSELQNLDLSGNNFFDIDLDDFDRERRNRRPRNPRNPRRPGRPRPGRPSRPPRPPGGGGTARSIFDGLRQFGRQAIQYGRGALTAAEGLANAPLVEGAAAGGTTVGSAVLGVAAGILATAGIIYGTDKFIESTNVDARKKQEEGTARFGLTGNGLDGFYINGKGPYTFNQLPEYYQNVASGYGANARGTSAERAREYVQTHNPDGTLKSQSKQTTRGVVEAPEITVTASKREETVSQQRASRDSAKVNDKLVKTATKAAVVQAKPVKKAEPIKAMSKQGTSWTDKVSAFIGNTYNSVTSFMGGFLSKLASLGSQIGSFLSGGAQDLAGYFGFGGGPGYQQANLAGAKGDWVRDASFISGVNALAQKYNIDAGDLLGMMWSESGLNPQAVNPNGGATGLIQFMPSTAKAMGTTTGNIYKMNRTQQLALVDRFFAMNKLPSGATAGQLYATVFLPAYNRRADNFVVARAGGANDAGQNASGSWYKQNAGLDVNRDGAITIADLGQRVSKMRQQIGLGPSMAGSGFRALGNLATGAMSSFGGAIYEAATSAIRGIGDFIMPVASVRVTSGFGPRQVPPGTGGKGSTMHRGVDFGAKVRGVSGDPIYAAAPGTIVMARPYKGYGNFIKIDHGSGMETRYGHLLSYATAEGQRVQKGQMIGRMGNTGISSAAHLHFELLKSGTPVDPLRFLGASTLVRPDAAATEPGNEQALKPGTAPPVTKPTSQLAQDAQQAAIDKKKKAKNLNLSAVSDAARARGGVNRNRSAIGDAARQRGGQNKKKSPIDQFLGYFNAA